nr:hypothetical protein [uncultured Dokdonia sp.]
MLKNISNLGETLNKEEQQSITGGKLDGNPPEFCMCTQLTYLVNGEVTTEYPLSGPVQVVGWTDIIPVPACCH